MSKRSEQQKTYREINKEKIREQRKLYREANKEKIKKQQKAWYDANSEKAKLKSKAYYETNNDKAKKQRTAWRKNNQEKMNQYNKNYQKKNPEKLFSSKLKRQYGLTLDEYNLFLKQSDNRCPICDTAFDLINKHKANRPCVDHCHKSGKIRGIICGKCNAAIGQLNDDVKLLEKAIQWLQQSY